MGKQFNDCINISIVIPVYNTEKYLVRCINSILKQNISNYEIIVVDDCSTDHSYEILKVLSEQYKQIKLFRNENNMGAGYTKNKALRLCRGKYICFVDSDDWLLDGALGRLYRMAEELQCDDIFYELISISENEDKKIVDENKKLIVDQIYSKGIFLFEKMLDDKKVTVSACHYFFRRKCLTDKTVFSEHSINDDWNFTAMLLNNVGKTVVLKNRYYVYFRRMQGSITNKTNNVSLISETYNHAINIYNNFSELNETYKRVKQKCFLYMMIEIQNDILKRKKGWEKEKEEVECSLKENLELNELFEKSKFISQYGEIDKEILQQLKTKKDVYIYGAGNYGIEARRILEAYGIDVKAFIVSRICSQIINDIPVFGVDEVECTEDSFWIIAVSDKYKSEIIEIVKNKGVSNYGYLVI